MPSPGFDVLTGLGLEARVVESGMKTLVSSTTTRASSQRCASTYRTALAVIRDGRHLESSELSQGSQTLIHSTNVYSAPTTCPTLSTPWRGVTRTPSPPPGGTHTQDRALNGCPACSTSPGEGLGRKPIQRMAAAACAAPSAPRGWRRHISVHRHLPGYTCPLAPGPPHSRQRNSSLAA